MKKAAEITRYIQELSLLYAIFTHYYNHTLTLIKTVNHSYVYKMNNYNLKELVMMLMYTEHISYCNRRERGYSD